MAFIDEIRRRADEFEDHAPQPILEWAIPEYGDDLAMSSSFQAQSMPLLHMATRLKPDLRIFFLDTGCRDSVYGLRGFFGFTRKKNKEKNP